jgi:type VI secretion system protein ImpG
MLWPLSVTEVKYVVGTSSFATAGLRLDPRTRAACRIAMRASAGVQVRELPLDSLSLFVYATADLAAKIHEQIFANCVGVAVRSKVSAQAPVVLPARAIRSVGFEDDESLLPAAHARFQGYRLLQEYFAFPERFLFFAVDGLRDALKRCDGDEFELLLLFDRSMPDLENTLDASQFRLNCTPVVNLFPRSLDRVHVSPHQTELHVVPELSRPMDFEIYSLDRGARDRFRRREPTEVLPFYSTRHRDGMQETRTYYTVQRRPRLASARQRRTGVRTNYLGSEFFMTIVDSHDRDITGEDQPARGTGALHEPRPADRAQLRQGAPRPHARRWSAGRDRPLPRGPTQPRPSTAFGDTAWKLIGQLSLNYLSLTDTDPDRGAEGLRQLLGLYADPNDSAAHRQIDGVRSIVSRAVVRRVPRGGPITFGRGLELKLLRTTALSRARAPAARRGVGAILRTLRLAEFLRRDSTAVLDAGDIKQWPARTGTRQII